MADEKEKTPPADPAKVAPGTPVEQLPDDWVCPGCGLGKDALSPA